MDPNQLDPSAVTPDGPTTEVATSPALASSASTPSSGGGEQAGAARPAPPLWPAAPATSSVRKAQVRAALFHKVEPVRIGRFILLEPLGGGAMGEIYAAYDDQLDRKVALKLMRGGVDPTGKADERLLREAQTLAQVSHPNVVHIYEAGRYNGRLFIAMELIRGKTLSTWLRGTAQLPRAVRQREILRQFVAAGRGLEAAHAAGVAHRDFKPDNVLVGDDGRVRVVDFGLARALTDSETAPVPRVDVEAAPRSDDAAGSAPRFDDAAGSAPLVTGGITLELPPGAPARGHDTAPSGALRKAAIQLTETGTVMGTPSYMAPEQMRGAIADLRSDQFSFCVALYYALYDAFPFAGRSLRELQDAMASDKVAFAPGVSVPGFIRRALLRGLSVEPSQRFATMSELLAAIEPKRRRSRGWTAAAVGVLTAGALAAVAALRSQSDPCAAAGSELDAGWSAARQAGMQDAFSRSQLPFADITWRGVKTRLDSYASRWRDEATAACKATQVAHTQSAQQLDRRMLCLDRGRRQLTALASALESGAADAVDHAIEATEQLPDPGVCSRIENIQFGLEPPPPAIAAKVAAVRDQIAKALVQEALGHEEASLTIAQAADAAAQPLGYPPVRAEALAQIARAIDARDTEEQRANAKQLYFEALDIAETNRHDQLAADIWNRLVMLAARRDSDMAQAHAWWRRNAAAVHRLGDDPYEQAALHHTLGEIYYNESKYVDAAEAERRAIAAIAHATGHQLELSRYNDALAKSLEYLDKVDEAVGLHERALAIATTALGPTHGNVIKLQINYGKALEKQGQLDHARSVLQSALDSMSASSRSSHPDAGRIRSFLSDLDYREGHLDRAAEHARASLEIYRRTLSPDDARLAAALTNLANVELKRRNFREALDLYEEALALRHRSLGNRHYHIGVNEGSLAETLFALARYDEAMTHLVKAEQIFAGSSGHERWTEAWLLTVRGEILAGQRRLSAAATVLERAMTLFGDEAADPVNQALAMWTLARVLYKLGGDSDRVRSLATRAHAIFTAQGAIKAQERDAVAQLLARLPARNKQVSPATVRSDVPDAKPMADQQSRSARTER